MRYARTGDLVRLILRMQGSHTGVSLDDIEEEFAVTRRTAERMRNAVLRLFPETVVHVDEDQRKHWRIPPGLGRELVGWKPEELAALDAAIEVTARDGRPDHASALRSLSTKIGALIRDEAMTRIAPDLELLCEGQGLAMRPGPRPAIDHEALEALRWAMLACRKVQIEYAPRGPDASRSSVVHPYGFLCGNGHYLVAHSERGGDVHLYRLSSISSVALLEDDFERDEQFDLRRFAENSFGVFQEEPFDVVWRFAPEVAGDAADFEFHPSQNSKRHDDGSLEVRFRAGGMLEMAWHLFRWGPWVEIVEPPALREKLVTLLAEAYAAHADGDGAD